MAAEDPIRKLLLNYITLDEYALFAAPAAQSQSRWGKYLVFDAPIKNATKYMAKTMAYSNDGFIAPCAVMGNEGGAIYGSLLACGYSAREIVGVWADGFDPIELIEGGQKLPSRIHLRSGGAEHKGLRLRDALDVLYRKKLGLSDTAQMTFADLLARTHVQFYVSVFDGAIRQPTIISAATHPQMPVADAVLATCAVQPYIRAFEWTAPKKNPSDKSEKPLVHPYCSCSSVKTVPITDAMALYGTLNVRSQFKERLRGYTCNETVNSMADASTDIISGLNAIRAPPMPQIPPEFMSNVRIFQ